MKSREILVGGFLSFIFFISFFMFSIPYYSGDVINHIVWGESIINEGSLGFYAREFKDISLPNYPPVSMLSFAAAYWFYGFLRSTFTALNIYPLFPSGLLPWINSNNVEISFLKIPALVPFVLTGWIIYLFGRLLKKTRKESLIFTLLFLLNPSFIYLAVIWGQNDFAQVFFILGAFYLLLKENYYLSFIFAGLSILSKQTVLMLWGFYLITLFKLKGLNKSVTALAISISLMWLFYLPFNNQGIFWPFVFYNETLTKSTGFLVSDNAINFWGIFSGFEQVDAGKVELLISYEKWGFLAFSIMILPLFYKYLKSKFSNELLISFLFMISITYFFALTRMHERYLFFGVIFAQLLFMIKSKYWFNPVFFSLFYFLNLYRGLFQPDFKPLTSLVYNETFLTLMVVSYLIILAYNYYLFMFKLSKA